MADCSIRAYYSMTKFYLSIQIWEAAGTDSYGPSLSVHLPPLLWLSVCQYRGERLREWKEVLPYRGRAEQGNGVWGEFISAVVMQFVKINRNTMINELAIFVLQKKVGGKIFHRYGNGWHIYMYYAIFNIGQKIRGRIEFPEGAREGGWRESNSLQLWKFCTIHCTCTFSVHITCIYMYILQEIAVIHKVPRTANIIARENIEVLVVDPPTCFRIFPEEINREYNLTLENMRCDNCCIGLWRPLPIIHVHVIDGRACGALVQFGCYQYRYEWMWRPLSVLG